MYLYSLYRFTTLQAATNGDTKHNHYENGCVKQSHYENGSAMYDGAEKVAAFNNKAFEPDDVEGKTLSLSIRHCLTFIGVEIIKREGMWIFQKNSLAYDSDWLDKYHYYSWKYGSFQN